LDGIILFLCQRPPQRFAEPQKSPSQKQLQLHFQLPKTLTEWWRFNTTA
jgi:hypothetical protein